ncbi:hypothetical protein KH990_06675 [Methanoculleus bourgensis]|jgi:hypothetical protein|uniref:hypothetical protein n=1 Tax=Methanoculleus bourgensis TaxID=83986 RepID=UPI001BDAEA66|nr:hypothetical protein [Methanoculleus bourgensis]MBT0733052.1 hypothetical protein [Methanoculleus bourgensis]
MIKVEYVAQTDQAIDCGIAGIAMLVKCYRPKVSYGEIVSSLSLPCTFSYFPGSLASQATWLWDEDYRFLAELYGLRYISSPHQGNATDEHYEEYLQEIKNYVDRDIPIMVGGWDLYYDEFYRTRLEAWGMGPGQTGHNIIVVGYGRDGIYYLDPGAVVNKRDNVGHVTYLQKYEAFRLAVTSFPGVGKLYYCAYENIAEPLLGEEKITLIDQRSRKKYYGHHDVYDPVYVDIFRHSVFGSKAFDALERDLELEIFSHIITRRKYYSNEGFLASSLGVGSIRYFFYTNAWATEWGSTYLKETGQEDKAKVMADLSVRFKEGEKIFTDIFCAYENDGSLNSRKLKRLQIIVKELEYGYRNLLKCKET